MSAPRNPDWHPDAESLSAFLEGALPEHERSACLAHFAECARCRDIVFQAQEPAPAAIVPKPESRWRRWWTPVPVFAAAAALCALAAGIAMYLHRKPEPPVQQQIAVVSPPPIPPAPPAPAVREPKAPPVHHHDVASIGVRPVPPPSPPPVTPTIQLDGVNASQQAPPGAGAAYVNLRPFQLRILHDDTLAVNTSRIAGTVADPSGAAISGALVRLQAPTGSTAANARTDANGHFELVSLTPGRYELQIQSAGFTRATAPIELHGQDLATVTPVLAVGSTSESVEVTAEASKVVVAGSVTDGTATVDLPLQGRSAALLELAASSAPSTVSIGKLQLRTDPSGALLRSQNSGKSWKAIKPAWKGKIVQLSTHDDFFQLTTDSGAVWTSRDGAHWTLAPPQH